MAITIYNDITPAGTTNAVLSADNSVLTITCNDGYIFDKAPTFYYYSEYGDEVDGTTTLSDDKKTAIYNSFDTPLYDEIYISGTTVEGGAPVKTITINNNILPAGTTNAVLSADNSVLTITCNDGYIFDNAPLIIYYAENGDEINVHATLSADNKTATVSDFNPPLYEELDIDGQTVKDDVPVTPPGNDYGAINVYIVTDGNLEDFAKVRFTKYTGSDMLMYIDLGKYVNRIKRIYTNIENGKDDVIKCADYDTKISVHQPKSDKITLDFGTVTITDHNKDNTDYESNIQLFVPFTGLVSIPNEYIGKEIHLYIDINVITGGGLYRLVCDDIQFQAGECTPSTDVLYRTVDDNKIGGDTWNEKLFMGLEPYIILKWYESKNPNGRNNDRQTGILGDFRGFNVFDDVTPIHTPEMLTEEQEMIYMTLSDGVYIE